MEYLYCKCSDGRNDVQRAAEHRVARECGIILPDGGSVLDCCHFGDGRHDAHDTKVDDVFKTPVV
jgi:hypothetical protein